MVSTDPVLRSRFLSDHWNTTAYSDSGRLDQEQREEIEKITVVRNDGSFWQWLYWVDESRISNDITHRNIAERCGIGDNAVSNWFSRKQDKVTDRPDNGEPLLPEGKNKPDGANVLMLATHHPDFARRIEHTGLERAGLRFTITWIRAEVLRDEDCNSSITVAEFEFLFHRHLLDTSDNAKAFEALDDSLKKCFPRRDEPHFASVLDDVMKDWSKAYRLVLWGIRGELRL